MRAYIHYFFRRRIRIKLHPPAGCDKMPAEGYAEYNGTQARRNGFRSPEERMNMKKWVVRILIIFFSIVSLSSAETLTINLSHASDDELAEAAELIRTEQKSRITTKIVLNRSSTVIETGKSIRIAAMIVDLPDGENEPVLSWSSSDPDIAVCADGTVTAISDGDAVISCSAVLAGGTVVTGECTVQVGSGTKNRLELLFSCWQENDLDGMLELCLPSWRAKQEKEKIKLFEILQNRSPVSEITYENEHRANPDTVEYILHADFDTHSGREPVRLRMWIMMERENGIWYVDPEFLSTYEPAEEPDNPRSEAPALQETQTSAQQINGNTVLYYNPSGGALYHTDQNCISVHPVYLPLSCIFSYAQVGDEKYINLQPCRICGAPMR